MQEYRPRTCKAFGFGADTLAFQSVVEALFKQQALDDEALEGDFLHLADSFPSRFSKPKAIILVGEHVCEDKCCPTRKRIPAAT